MHCSNLYRILLVALPLWCSCSAGEPREPVKPDSSISMEADALSSVNKQLIEREKERIEAMILQKDWKMNSHPDGYYSMIISEGKGKMITENASVELLCKVELLDGTVCYDHQKRSFIVNKTTEIAGLHQGVINMRQGAKVRFIFPPHLAYGLLGDRNAIPPRASLIFDVDIVKVNE